MHPAVFDAFEEICRRRGAGGRVLEIGAVPADDTLLCLPCLRDAPFRLGVNLAPASRYAGFEILQADANDLSMLEAESFDVVVSNSTLEHDPRFWRTLAEARRVARQGALLVVGVPGFTHASAARRLRRLARHLPVARSLLSPWLVSTPVLGLHPMPGDYYRFSEEAVRMVFLEGCDEREVTELLVPPRLVGAGRVR